MQWRGAVFISGGCKPTSAMRRRRGLTGRTPRALAVAWPDHATCGAALQNCMSEGLNGVEFDPNPLRLTLHPRRVRRRSVAFHGNTRASGSGPAVGPGLDFSSRDTAWTSTGGTQICRHCLSSSRPRRRAACSPASDCGSDIATESIPVSECRVPTLCRNETWRSSSYVP